jgi:outer membrane protein insertion porin family
LPPYEAFPIGGTNSVRGYAEGGIGTGRNFVGATSELIFPLVKPLDGTVFGTPHRLNCRALEAQ